MGTSFFKKFLLEHRWDFVGTLFRGVKILKNGLVGSEFLTSVPTVGTRHIFLNS
jgi:hypothetical protein